MANLRFTSDIVDDVLFRGGETTDGSSDFEDAALGYINRAYRGIWMGGGELDPTTNERWLWLKKDPPGVLILNPRIDVGTVIVTNNNATVTFSSAPAASVSGYFLQTEDDDAVFRVIAHIGGEATATLDSVYTGETGTHAYRLMKLEYELAADALQIIAPMRVAGEWADDIDGIELSVLDRDYPLSMTRGGTPDKFAMVTETKVRFNAYGGEESDELIRVEYDYLQRPADLTNSGSEEPLIPLHYRQVLADYALGLLLTVKDDSRATAILTQAAAGLKAMAIDNKQRQRQISRSSARLYPRPRGRWPTGRVLVTG
jgi:hypothetical protein